MQKKRVDSYSFNIRMTDVRMPHSYKDTCSCITMYLCVLFALFFFL